MLQGSSSSLGLVSAGEPTDFTNENVIVAADGPYANRIYFSGQFVIQNADWDRVSGCNSLSSVSIERWGTFSPTVAPSTSPTGWFEAPGHPENITELQSQTAGLAATVSTLSASVTSLQSSMLEQQTALARLASSVNPAVTTLQADVSRLRAAIANAVAGVPDVVRSNGNGGTAPPSISAEGSDSMVTAGRGVRQPLFCFNNFGPPRHWFNDFGLPLTHSSALHHPARAAWHALPKLVPRLVGG